MSELMKTRTLKAARGPVAEAKACGSTREEERAGCPPHRDAEGVEAPDSLSDEPSQTDQCRLAAKDDPEARRRLFIRMTLINDYRLSSAFIPVPKLALILGMSPSTIWSHMRQKRFPIPYRLFNTTPMVCIDDLVDWYCAKDDLIFPGDSRESPGARAQPRDEMEEERQRLVAETDAIVKGALAKLGIHPGRRHRQ